MFGRIFDADAGILHVRASGRLTISETAKHAEVLKAIVEDLRSHRIPIRVMVDIRDIDPLCLEVEAMFRGMKGEIYRVGDRVAILTRDTDNKHHVRSLLPGGEIWCWSSEFAAEEWLLLDGTIVSEDIKPRRQLRH